MGEIAKCIYKGGLRTEATHLKSKSVIQTDAPVDNNGKGEAFSPTDLLATSLASCILTIMGIRARDHDINMEGASARVTKSMASSPRRVERVQVEIKMPANDYSDKEKKILDKAARSCPVELSLHDGTSVEIDLIW